MKETWDWPEETERMQQVEDDEVTRGVETTSDVGTSVTVQSLEKHTHQLGCFCRRNVWVCIGSFESTSKAGVSFVRFGQGTSMI